MRHSTQLICEWEIEEEKRKRCLSPALPFCHFAIKAERPRHPDYPAVLNALGDHLRGKRLDLGLTQKQVAKNIGVDEATVHNWETNHTVPVVRLIPRIIEFLGYAAYLR